MNQPSAQTAIKTLRSLYEAVGPAGVAYFIAPNTVLTLSGARGFCDGVFYASDQATRKTWQQEITSAAEVLKTLVDVYSFNVSEEKSPSGNDYVAYDLLLREGLEYSLAATQLLAVSSTQLSRCAAAGTVSQAIKDGLKQELGTEQYSEDDFRYIATGLILGYPDKAIIGSIGQWGHGDNLFAPRLVQADIRGAGYYRCPQPVYSYPRSLVADPSIAQHEALWSGILRDFYESDFHESLKQQAEFQDKLLALGK